MPTVWWCSVGLTPVPTVAAVVYRAIGILSAYIINPWPVSSLHGTLSSFLVGESGLDDS